MRLWCLEEDWVPPCVADLRAQQLMPILRAVPSVTALSTVESRLFMGGDYGIIGLAREGASTSDTATLVAASLGDPTSFAHSAFP